MSKERPLILVTNDDGINAPGIRALIEVMNELGDVFVVAPDSPQSGMGHAITVNDAIYFNVIKSKEGEPQKEFSSSGTPVDCVKLAISEIIKRKPDLCVSGINHGSNSSINVNIPKLNATEIRGIKVCRQANAHWQERFDKRTNPVGRDYFWLTGIFVNEDEGEDTDEWALENGYVSVVPVQFDLTAHHVIDELNTWKL